MLFLFEGSESQYNNNRCTARLTFYVGIIIVETASFYIGVFAIYGLYFIIYDIVFCTDLFKSNCIMYAGDIAHSEPLFRNLEAELLKVNDVIFLQYFRLLMATFTISYAFS